MVSHEVPKSDPGHLWCPPGLPNQDPAHLRPLLSPPNSDPGRLWVLESPLNRDPEHLWPLLRPPTSDPRRLWHPGSLLDRDLAHLRPQVPSSCLATFENCSRRSTQTSSLSGGSPARSSAANACLAVQTVTSASSLAAATLTLCVPRQPEAKSVQTQFGKRAFLRGILTLR